MAKKGQNVWFLWSASESHKVKFIRWARMRMNTGDENTNQLGVGAVVWSDWLFSDPLMNSRQRQGLKAGYYAVRPYTKLYRNNPLAYGCRHKVVEVKRPKLEKVKKGILSRKTKNSVRTKIQKTL